MENAQIAEIFETIADLLDLTGSNEFRVRAYRQAARSIRSYSGRIADRVAEGEDLSDIPNVGDRTAAKIREIIQTGTCRRLEELRADMPEGLTDLMRIPGTSACCAA